MLGTRRTTGWIFAAAALWVAAPAQAAPVAYTMQIGGASRQEFVLDGHSLVGFSATVSAQHCSGTRWPADAEAVWTVALAQGQTVPISAGRFEFRGRAPASYYPAGSGSANYTVSGMVAAARGAGAMARRIVHGTISFTDGSAPSLTGCSGSDSFLAIPTPTASAPVAGPGSSEFTSQFLSFDYRKGSVRNLVLQANFECGGGPDPSVDSAQVDAAAYGFPQVQAHHGRFSLHAYVLDEYQDIVALKLTGRIRGRSASGQIKISEPPSLTGIANSSCSGDYAWTAGAPVPPAPSANFSWAAVRVPAGASYHYYFYITNLTCVNGATAVNIVIKGHATRIRCSAGQGWASGPLSPGVAYSTSAQAVKVRHHRMISRGVPVTGMEQMPPASATWQPVTGLRGNPPS